MAFRGLNICSFETLLNTIHIQLNKLFIHALGAIIACCVEVIVFLVVGEAVVFRVWYFFVVAVNLNLFKNFV